MKNFLKNKTRGYTIIETLIAISIFLVIITAGMSSLLTASSAHQKSQDIRSVMDSLTFIMEELSRNLRTGYDYSCTAGTPEFCGTIMFENAFGNEADPDDQWGYKVEGDGVNFNIFKTINNGATWVQLNQTEVNLSSVSGFSVLGASSPPADTQQPLVVIKLLGTITFKNTTTPFAIQTSVSQRLVDI